jgi:hypothetical protein
LAFGAAHSGVAQFHCRRASRCVYRRRRRAAETGIGVQERLWRGAVVMAVFGLILGFGRKRRKICSGIMTHGAAGAEKSGRTTRTRKGRPLSPPFNPQPRTHVQKMNVGHPVGILCSTRQWTCERCWEYESRADKGALPFGAEAPEASTGNLQCRRSAGRNANRASGPQFSDHGRCVQTTCSVSLLGARPMTTANFDSSGR